MQKSFFLRNHFQILPEIFNIPLFFYESINQGGNAVGTIFNLINLEITDMGEEKMYLAYRRKHLFFSYRI